MRTDFRPLTQVILAPLLLGPRRHANVFQQEPERRSGVALPGRLWRRYPAPPDRRMAVHLGMSVGRTEPKQKRNSTFSDGGFAHGIFPTRPRARPTILAADAEMTKESTRWQGV
jgi:hypothetical protein